MEWEIAKFALTAAVFTVLSIFGYGFVATFLAGYIASAFKEPDRPEPPTLTKEERRQRHKARYDSERPIFGIRWRYVLTTSAYGSLVAVEVMAICFLSVSIARSLTGFASAWPNVVLIGLAMFLPVQLFPKVAWGYVGWKVLREVGLIVGWILSLVYCTSFYAVGDMRGVWAFGILMGVGMTLIFQDLMGFIDRSYKRLEETSTKARLALNSYIERQPRYQMLTQRFSAKKS